MSVTISAPDDAQRFGPEALARLRQAAEEANWLLSREYPPSQVFALVREHRKLDARQLLAVERAYCSDAQQRRRMARYADEEDAARRTIWIDGGDVLAAMEAALAGAPLFEGFDECVRALTGPRTEYAPSEHAAAARDALTPVLRALRPSKLVWAFDARSPAREAIAALFPPAARAKPETRVEFVDDLPAALARADLVATGDPGVLDTCRGWVNLVGPAVRQTLPKTRIIKLG